MALNPDDKGTVTSLANFDPVKDAEIMKKAMKGAGTDETAIIHILSNRSNQQRQKIAEAFFNKHKKDLTEELKSEVSGNLRHTIVALMTKPSEFDAQSCNKAIKGAGTDEDTLVEILATRSYEERQGIAEAYKKLYEKQLVDDIKGDTSGAFEKLLLTLVTATRDPAKKMNAETAKEDAKSLHEAGVKKFGTDKGTFNTIFATRSFPHLRQVFQEYQHLAKHSMEEAIKKEMTGDYQKAFLDLITMVKDSGLYFAKRIEDAVKGMGTKDHQLIRILVTRCEKDMVQIKEAYRKHFDKSLQSAIESDTSGDYKKALIALVS